MITQQQEIQSPALRRKLRENRLDRCVRLAFITTYGQAAPSMMRFAACDGLVVSTEKRRILSLWRAAQ